ncbi:hypothetical protein G7Z17_g1342 [Cylindrodendrum hubeiense]|uniref:DUF3533 domain-containing protein n=1 Tax=Cylindrodendrum hubeiense TaxID=595255 RepID=A0A9P5LM83_9HYPO|nr:hypothetical protein G7Z17_g1342 [Cylindrodendrum hubeiense]
MSALLGSAFNRERLFSPFWAARWKKSFLLVAAVGLLLQLIFLGNMCYLYGIVFKSASHTHNLKILAVDFDGAEVGESLLTAYQSLKANTFPTIEYGSASRYPTPESLRKAVCNEGYWAAVYTHHNASERLMAAIEGKATHNASDTITYIYDAVYYPVVAASFVESSLQRLINGAAHAYYTVAPDALATVNLTNPISASAFLTPIMPTSTIILPTTQGSRVLLNTVSMIIPILMQFFFIMVSNLLFTEANVYLKLWKRDLILLRILIGKIGSVWATQKRCQAVEKDEEKTL